MTTEAPSSFSSGKEQDEEEDEEDDDVDAVLRLDTAPCPDDGGGGGTTVTPAAASSKGPLLLLTPPPFSPAHVKAPAGKGRGRKSDRPSLFMFRATAWLLPLSSMLPVLPPAAAAGGGAAGLLGSPPPRRPARHAATNIRADRPTEAGLSLYVYVFNNPWGGT